jgi:hypothetical protein
MRAWKKVGVEVSEVRGHSLDIGSSDGWTPAGREQGFFDVP